jgi:hypothetical protein
MLDPDPIGFNADPRCFGAGYELPPDLEDALYTSHLSVPVKERLTSIRNCNLVGAALPVTEPGVSVK